MSPQFPTEQRIALLDQYPRIRDLWSPKVVAQVNDQYVKVARVQGEFPWHFHEGEDELFLVMRGRLRLEFRDHAVELSPGECCVVRRGVEHRPVAAEECWLVLVETVTTRHTGNVTSELTRSIDEQLA